MSLSAQPERQTFTYSVAFLEIVLEYGHTYLYKSSVLIWTMESFRDPWRLLFTFWPSQILNYKRITFRYHYYHFKSICREGKCSVGSFDLCAFCLVPKQKLQDLSWLLDFFLIYFFLFKRMDMENKIYSCKPKFFLLLFCALK